SICLILQLALPVMAFAVSTQELVLKGGTDTNMAPPIDHYKMVFQPIAQRFGFHFDLKIVRRGYYPRGGGEVQIQTTPISNLNSIDLTEFGQIKRFFGRAFVAGPLTRKIAHEMSQTAQKLIEQKYPNIPIEIDVVKEDEKQAMGTGTGIIVGAETTTGCILANSALGKRGVPAFEVGKQATESLLNDLACEACVDTHLQDQLILLMALAKGKSRIRCGPITDHTKTAIYVVELMTKAKFTITEYSPLSSTTSDDKATASSKLSSLNSYIIECEGIGYQQST
ncbi:unnamed protein product, partial [Didymodactylos carnosus]